MRMDATAVKRVLSTAVITLSLMNYFQRGTWGLLETEGKEIKIPISSFVDLIAADHICRNADVLANWEEMARAHMQVISQIKKRSLCVWVMLIDSQYAAVLEAIRSIIIIA